MLNLAFKTLFSTGTYQKKKHPTRKRRPGVTYIHTITPYFRSYLLTSKLLSSHYTHMKIVRNNVIPVRGYAAIALFPFLFVRKGVEISDRLIRHEKTHFRQQIELLIIPFYIWYLIEYLVRLIGWLHFLKWKEFSVASHLAYRNVCFEQEAYNNEHNPDYLPSRKPYAWTEFL